MNALEKIRNQYRNENTVLNPCPHCAKEVTIEETKYMITEVCENCLSYVKIRDRDECCSNPELINVKYLISGGSYQVRKQCLTCGYVARNPIGGFTKETRDQLPDLDKSKRNYRDEEDRILRRAFYDALYQKRQYRREEAYQEKQEKYKEYLNSDEWKNKRLDVLKRDNYLCQSCLDAYATQVHHRSYRLEDLSGNVPAFDLVAICVPCHENIHQKTNPQNVQNQND